MDGLPIPMRDREHAVAGSTARKGRYRRPWKAFVRRHMIFILVVILPTLIASLYYFGIAADQYESETEFLIYSSHGTGLPVGGLGQMLGIGDTSGSQTSETYSVIDYMQSHDAVAALNEKLNLVHIFRAPQADMLARLWWPHPSAERLLKYYRSMVTLTYKQNSGITTLDVHAFTPDDSYNIANMLLTLGEDRVNAYNDRVTADTIKVAQNEVALAQQRIEAAQTAITRFREDHGDLNPEVSGTSDMTLIAQLQAQLAQASAQLAQMHGLGQESPQMVASRNRIAALKQQIAVQNGTLVGSSDALAPVLADYQGMALKLQFAQQSYTAAQTALETAHEDAQKQQLFLIRVVQPNMPQMALFPHRVTIVVTVFVALLLAYGILWLMIAGVREHAV
jgi:capsular polysaccharide transport system permease protein